ncbi:Hint domain-containing protein [Octadecabacter temperatus]|nr:Hint domain-containing protein [Octadecabacter temperatus]
MRNSQTGANIYVWAKHLPLETRLALFARGLRRITYVHVLLDQHATLISNDIPSESFYPGPVALQMLPILNRLKLYAVIPDLLDCPVEQAYGSRAEPVLSRKEMREIAKVGGLASLDGRLVEEALFV